LSVVPTTATGLVPRGRRGVEFIYASLSSWDVMRTYGRRANPADTPKSPWLIHDVFPLGVAKKVKKFRRRRMYWLASYTTIARRKTDSESGMNEGLCAFHRWRSSRLSSVNSKIVARRSMIKFDRQSSSLRLELRDSQAAKWIGLEVGQGKSGHGKVDGDSMAKVRKLALVEPPIKFLRSHSSEKRRRIHVDVNTTIYTKHFMP